MVLDMAAVSSHSTCMCVGPAVPRTKSSVTVSVVAVLLEFPCAGISLARFAVRARLGETGVGVPFTECTSAMGTGSESSPALLLNSSSNIRVRPYLRMRG